MRRLLFALACVAVSPAIAHNQKIVPGGHPALAAPVQSGGDSICDNVANNRLANCGFETGDFTAWSFSGDTSFTSLDPACANSGGWGGCFGVVGDRTFLFTSPVDGFTATQWHVDFYYANLNGGTPNEFSAVWSADGQFDDAQVLLSEVDAPPLDWYPVGFGPLPGLGDGVTAPSLSFVFRHDPDYWFLDDVDVEPLFDLGSQAARPASSLRHRTDKHVALPGPANRLRFGFGSPAETVRSFVPRVNPIALSNLKSKLAAIRRSR